MVSAISTYNVSALFESFESFEFSASAAGSGSGSGSASGSGFVSGNVSRSYTEETFTQSVVNHTGVLVSSTQELLIALGTLQKIDLGEFNITLAMQAALEVVGQVNASSLEVNTTGRSEGSLAGRLDVVNIVDSKVNIDQATLTNVAAIQSLGVNLFAVTGNPETSPAVLAELSSKPSSTFSVIANGTRELVLAASKVEQSLIPGRLRYLMILFSFLFCHVCLSQSALFCDCIYLMSWLAVF